MFLKPSEVFSRKNKIGLVGISRRNGERLAGLGMFPKTVKLSPGRCAYRSEEIERWIKDPEGWREQQ